MLDRYSARYLARYPGRYQARYSAIYWISESLPYIGYPNSSLFEYPVSNIFCLGRIVVFWISNIWLECGYI